MRIRCELFTVVFLTVLTGCMGTAREAGRQAAAGAFEVAQAELSKRLDAVQVRIDAEAAKANAALEAKAPAIILAVRDSLTPQIDAAIQKGGDSLQATLDARIMAAEAKRKGGEPLSPMEWFYIALGASGLGAGGVATGKAALRRILGLKIPVERQDPTPPTPPA